MSTEHEDGPPNIPAPDPPPSYPEFAGPEEITKTDLRSPAPVPRRDTMSPADAERLMVRKALEASAAATEALTAILPTLATKDDVAAIHQRLDELIRRVGGLDAGVGAMGDELATLDTDMRKGFADTETWLFGDPKSETRRSVVGDLGIARDQVNSALGAISTLPPRLKAIEDKLEGVAEAAEKSLRVACGSWMQVTTGEVDDRDRETISAIIVSHGSGR